MKKTGFKKKITAGIFVWTLWALIFSQISFAQETVKPAKEDGKVPEVEYEVNINQIAFIIKFDKDENGKLDHKEFTGKHFKTMDKNGDGFIEPHEAPEGQTSY